MEKEVYTRMALMEERHWWYRARRDILGKILEKKLQKSSSSSAMKILDIGCGTGGNYPLLTKFGDVSGVEMDKYAIKIANKKYPDLKIIQAKLPDIKINQTMGMETTNACAGEYDCVTLLDVLEHIADEKEALANINQLLANDGVLVITVPAFMFLWSKSDVVDFHKRRYTRKTLLKTLEKAGFHVNFISYFNFFLFLPALLGRMYIKFKKNYQASEEIQISNKLLNEILYNIFKLEALFLPNMKFPFGVSLVAAANKRNINNRR